MSGHLNEITGECRNVDVPHIALKCFIWTYQVKPLLQVTRQDEEIQVRETELQKAKDNLTRVELDYTELDKKHLQVNKFPFYSADCPSLFCLH